jgi:hypothetical protein
MLTVRGALGGGFGMGDIGKAIRAVSQDPPKMPDAVQQRIQQAAENPQKLVGDANQAFAGADATKAVDTAKGAAQSASGALPAVVSVAVDGSRGGVGPAQSTTASPVELPGEAATGSQVVQDALSDMFDGRGVKGTVDKASPGTVAGAIAKMKGDSIENAASQVSERGQKFAKAVQEASAKDIVNVVSGPAAPSSALSQAMSQAKRALDRKKAEVGSLAEKAKTATVKDMMDLAGTDDAKKGAEIVKLSTWQDLSNAVRRGDVKSAIANPDRTVQSIGKIKFLSPTGGRQDERGGAGVDGEEIMVDARLVAVVVLAGVVLGAYALLRRLAKPRRAGVGMLSGDHEQVSIAAARGWMGASAQDVVSNSPGPCLEFPAGCSSQGFSRF